MTDEMARLEVIDGVHLHFYEDDALVTTLPLLQKIKACLYHGLSTLEPMLGIGTQSEMLEHYIGAGCSHVYCPTLRGRLHDRVNLVEALVYPNLVSVYRLFLARTSRLRIAFCLNVR
jgi:hypothetical protein